MSALKFKKQFLFLPLIVVLLVVAFILLKPSAETIPTAVEKVAVTQQKAESHERVDQTTRSEPVIGQTHSDECTECDSAVHDVSETSYLVETQPQFDRIFKSVARKSEVLLPRSDFEFLIGSSKGQSVSFGLDGIEYSGTVNGVLEGEVSSAYAVTLDNSMGRLIVDLNSHGQFSGQILFFGDSRVLKIRDHLSDGESPMLIVEETTVSELYCAPKGTIYTQSGFKQNQATGNAELSTKELAPLVGIAEAIALNSLPNSDFVIYCNFDGEEVTDLRWNGGDLISAAPHPLANDDEWVTSVWKRVVEDFAPFDITVTTDEAVYNAADEDKRLHVIITPTDDVAPGSGGVAGLFSFRSNSPIVWVFNLSEYACASTISHEAGHAFGLRHDGTPLLEYYPGHNTGYAPGWGPIMGAPFADGLDDEVDQWSSGEYLDANNQEDDIAIIGNNRNGFGFKADDYGDTVATSGALSTIDENTLGAKGIISRSFDVDVFRFSSGDGDISLTVSPLDVDSGDSQPGSNTQGANLAVEISLLDSVGALIASGIQDGPVALGARIDASVTAGTYYLTVTGAGRGASAEVGFSEYASQGGYSVVGLLPVPPLTVEGGAKNDQAILLGDTESRAINGTDFGFSYVANSAITNTFRLANTQSSDLTNVSVSLASGADFTITSAPVTSIPGNSSTSMSIAYDPLQTGVDVDTVVISYNAPDSEIFEFAIGGTSTKSATEDNYGPGNNIASGAANLNAFEDVWLSDNMGEAFFMSSQVDFYTFTVDANDGLITVETAYDSSDGPVTFQLANWRGDILVTSVVENGRLQFLIPEVYAGNKLKFSIRVSNIGDTSVRNAYDLRWSAIPLLTGDDDLYEENDELDLAYDLTGAISGRLSEILGTAVSNDEDWYKIEIPADPFVRMLYIAAEFEHAAGDINIELIDPNGGGGSFFLSSAVSDSLNDREVITYYDGVSTADYAENFSPPGNTLIMGVPPGTYYVRVYGDLNGNEYDLVVETRRDDSYEVVDPITGTENDSQENAFFLGGSIVNQWLSDIDGVGISANYPAASTQENFTNTVDSDWYEFTIDSTGSAQQLVLEYESFTGFMLFQLINEDGDILGTNTETEGNTTTIFSGGEIVIPLAQGSRYYISVIGLSSIDALSGYDFRVTFTSEPPFIEGAVEDNYEENDNYQEPFDLKGNAGLWLTAVDGHGVSLDPDWYEIVVPVGATRLDIECVFDTTQGALDVTLSKKDGPRVLFSTPEPNSATITWDDPLPGVYAITVTGDRRGNEYNLFWDVVRGEDNYEENDTRLSSFPLTTERTWLSKIDGFGIQKDQDWYEISVPAGASELQIRTAFDPLLGDIDLELYNAAGFLIARSISPDSVESITLDAPAAGTYYIQLHYGDNGSEYDLWWGTFTQAELNAITEDAYEANNAQGAAYVLPSDQIWLGDVAGLGTQTDDDWFEITIEENNVGLDIDLTFTHADGDIDVEVYDDFGAILDRSSSLSDNETINYNAPLSAGTYYIRVYGSNVGNSYDFYWVDRNQDAYEVNNTMATAHDLSFSPLTPLSTTGVATQGDEDWYKISSEVNNSTLVVNIDFVHSNGNIDLEVYDNAGSLVGSSITALDVENVRASVNSGDYFIRVLGANAYNDYDVIWSIAADDSYENNGDFASSASLDGLEGALIEGIQYDDDWFSVTTDVGDVRLLVNLLFTHNSGDLSLEIYDSAQNLLRSSESATNNESIIWGTDPDGATYHIRVFGENFGTNYQLTWNSFSEDAYEENDFIEEAYDLTSLESTFLSDFEGRGSLYDDDWYQIELASGDSSLFVSALFDNADGGIDIELFDSDFIVVDFGDATPDGQLIIHDGSPGVYYVKVLGGLPSDPVGNSYDLIWNSFSPDAFEPNNDFSSAASIENDELQIIDQLIQLDEDWYELVVAAGDNRLLVECLFGHGGGNIDIQLYDSGNVLVGGAESLSVTDNENLDIASLAPGSYFLKVFGADAANPYTLRWSSAAEDAYEENDSSTLVPASANLTPNEAVPLSLISGVGVAYDEDWFQIDLTDVENYFFADLVYVADQGNLDLQLLNAAGDVIAESVTPVSNESIEQSILSAGTYYLRVYGDTFGNDYDLSWRAFLDDNYEENDDLLSAYDFSASPNTQLSSIDGMGVHLDDDLYRVLVPQNSAHLTAELTFSHAMGNLEMSILRADGTPLGTVNTTTDDESLTVNVPLQSQFYYIRVSGPTPPTGNSYNLEWSTDTVDDYEPNDSFGDAFDISVLDDGELLSTLDVNDNGFGTQEGDDWYVVNISAGNVRLDLDLFFIDDDGDVNVQIIDSDGSTVLATADTVTSNESLSIAIDPTLTTFYIRVYGENSGNGYDLQWEVSSVDQYELNNFVEQSFDLSGNENVWLDDVDGHGTQFDDDWYMIVVSDTSPSLSVELDFINADGDIDLGLYQLVPSLEVDVPGTDQRRPRLVARSASDVDDFETITYLSPTPGIYFVRVYFGNSGNPYRLRWNDGISNVTGDQLYLDEEWEFSPIALAGMSFKPTSANDDGDQYPEWAELALNLDPSTYDQAIVNQYVAEADDGKTYFFVEYVRTKEAGLQEYRFTVQTSSNLQFTGAEAVYVDTVSISDDVEKLVYRSPEDTSVSGTSFFRLVVEEPLKGHQ
jgi:hypothetical protein